MKTISPYKDCNASNPDIDMWHDLYNLKLDMRKQGKMHSVRWAFFMLMDC